MAVEHSTSTCKFCSKKFSYKKPKRGKQSRDFCSESCRRKHKAGNQRRSCQSCGERIDPSAHGRIKFCSKACRPSAYRKQAKKEKACPHCGSRFVGTARQKYCSAECRSKAKQQRKYKRAKDAGKHRRPTGRSSCKECGKSFVVYAGTAGKFCSRSCSMANTAQDAQIHAARTETRREASLLRVLGKFCPVRSATCVQCKTGFIARNESVFCSPECASSHRKDHSKFYFRLKDGLCITEIRVCPVSGHLFKPEHMGQTLSCEGKRMTKAAHSAKSKAARRARMKGGDLIVPQHVFEQADYKCAICGCQTDPDKRGTCEDNAPELDHIIPLARGGTHTIENVQCACRSCNNTKRDTLPHDGNQARLIA